MINSVIVNQETTDLNQIEKICTQNLEKNLEKLVSHEKIEGAYILQTCHRAEAYIQTQNPEKGREALEKYSEQIKPSDKKYLDDQQSKKHLLSTAAGLNSIVKGEDEILGQVQNAREQAGDKLSKELKILTLQANRCGKQVRTDTKISEGISTLSSAAVKLASEKQKLENSDILVIGAGEMSEKMALKISEQPIKTLTIANRTLENAEKLAEKINSPVKTRKLEETVTKLDEYDVILTATGSKNRILHKNHLKNASPIYAVDAAQPRDIDPLAAEHKNVEIKDLDSLRIKVEKEEQKREKEETHAKQIVLEYLEKINEEINHQRSEEILREMHDNASKIREREKSRALKAIENGENPEKVLSDMAQSITSRVLQQPTTYIKQNKGEKELLDTAEQLLNGSNK